MDFVSYQIRGLVPLKEDPYQTTTVRVTPERLFLIMVMLQILQPGKKDSSTRSKKSAIASSCERMKKMLQERMLRALPILFQQQRKNPEATCST